MAYCYKLTHSSGKFYYGSRYAIDAAPYKLDFFKIYFTSSKEVKKLILSHGESTFVHECILE